MTITVSDDKPILGRLFLFLWQITKTKFQANILYLVKRSWRRLIQKTGRRRKKILMRPNK